MISGIAAQDLKPTSGAAWSANVRPVLATEGASRYVGGKGFTPVSIAVDGSGNTYVMGFHTVKKPVGGSKFEILLYKLNPQFEEVYSMAFGGEYGAFPKQMVLDAAGNVYMTAESDGFPLVDPIQSEVSGSGWDLLLAKLDPEGNIVFSTFFGGSGLEYPQALAVDDQGNAYIAGVTNSTDFPFTQDARPSSDPSLEWTMFVVKIATDPASLEFAANLGGGTSVSGSNDGFASIAPVPGGDVYLLQNTSRTEFPVTDGSSIGKSGYGQILARLSADGSRVVFATYVSELSIFSEFAVDPDGNLVLASGAGFVTWSTSTNQWIGRSHADGGLSPQIAVDPQGNVIAEAETFESHPISSSDGYPSGSDYLTKHQGISSQESFSTLLPAGAGDVGIAAGPNGEIYALGSSGLVSRFIPGNGDKTLPKIMGVANAAGSKISPKVAPGEIVSLYGPNIGSGAAATTQLGEDGRVTTTLAGVEVRFNGTPGSLLYTGPLQINAVAPFDLGTGDTVLVEVIHDGTPWTSMNLLPVDAAPGVFPGVIPANYSSNLVVSAALNEDGSINSSTNKAQPGSIVTIFVTGLGEMTGASYEDGEIFDPSTPLVDLPTPKYPIQIIKTLPLEILYAGQAPAALAGFVQVNFRLPETSSAQSDFPEKTFLRVPSVADSDTVTVGIWVAGTDAQ